MHAEALFIGSGALFFSRATKIVAHTARLAIPAIYPRREGADVGGLMSYGTNTEESYRVLGGYAGRILKGAKAEDLPVQQATRFELVLNLKTAKALGLTIPETKLSWGTRIHSSKPGSSKPGVTEADDIAGLQPRGWSAPPVPDGSMLSPGHRTAWGRMARPTQAPLKESPP
jgi:hypothetical protein